jgi:hypothetical protein
MPPARMTAFWRTDARGRRGRNVAVVQKPMLPARMTACGGPTRVVAWAQRRRRPGAHAASAHDRVRRTDARGRRGRNVAVDQEPDAAGAHDRVLADRRAWSPGRNIAVVQEPMLPARMTACGGPTRVVAWAQRRRRPGAHAAGAHDRVLADRRAWSPGRNVAVVQEPMLPARITACGGPTPAVAWAQHRHRTGPVLPARMTACWTGARERRGHVAVAQDPMLPARMTACWTDTGGRRGRDVAVAQDPMLRARNCRGGRRARAPCRRRRRADAVGA